MCICLFIASCAPTNRHEKRPRQQLALVGAESVIVVMNAKEFRPLNKCHSLGRMKIVSANLRSNGLYQALEELRAKAFIKGADHAVVVDYTDDLLFADLFFCSSDYSDFK
jgi:hypothetical protein